MPPPVENEAQLQPQLPSGSPGPGNRSRPSRSTCSPTRARCPRRGIHSADEDLLHRPRDGSTTPHGLPFAQRQPAHASTSSRQPGAAWPRDRARPAGPRAATVASTVPAASRPPRASAATQLRPPARRPPLADGGRVEAALVGRLLPLELSGSTSNPTRSAKSRSGNVYADERRRRRRGARAEHAARRESDHVGRSGRCMECPDDDRRAPMRRRCPARASRPRAEVAPGPTRPTPTVGSAQPSARAAATDPLPGRCLPRRTSTSRVHTAPSGRRRPRHGASSPRAPDLRPRGRSAVPRPVRWRRRRCPRPPRRRSPPPGRRARPRRAAPQRRRPRQIARLEPGMPFRTAQRIAASSGREIGEQVERAGRRRPRGPRTARRAPACPGAQSQPSHGASSIGSSTSRRSGAAASRRAGIAAASAGEWCRTPMRNGSRQVQSASAADRTSRPGRRPEPPEPTRCGLTRPGPTLWPSSLDDRPQLP